MRRTTLSRKPELGMVLSLAFVLLLGGTVRANPELYERVLRSTGWIIVPRDAEHSATGTCWLVDAEQKLAVTCQHVVGKSSEVLVYFPTRDRDEVAAEASFYLRKVPVVYGRVLATDEARDLALIQLQSVPGGVEPLSLAERSSRPGETVVSIGNSGISAGFEDGTLWWYTQGTVRQVHRERVKKDGAVKYIRMVETQAPVNQGDSGGPVVNDEGKLVGVTHAYEADQRLVSENIDVQEVKSFLHDSEDKVQDAEPGKSVVGSWWFAGQASEEKKIDGNAEFKSDGTFRLISTNAKDKAKQGRYLYANGVLWLIFDQGHASVSVTWADKDRFTFSSTRPELVFQRGARPADRRSAWFHLLGGE